MQNEKRIDSVKDLRGTRAFFLFSVFVVVVVFCFAFFTKILHKLQQQDSNPQPLISKLYRPVWINGWCLFTNYGCGFESHCCHLNFKYYACFEQGVSWHSGSCVDSH